MTNIDRRRDPLGEIVLRCTVPAPELPLDADSPTGFTAPAPGAAKSVSRVEPQSSPAVNPPAELPIGLRNRLLALDAVRQLITIDGPSFSLAAVAAAAGVDEAALQSQFANADAVLSALLLAEVATIIEQLAHRGVADALVRAAVEISDHPLLESLGHSGQLLARMARVDVRQAGWALAAHAVDDGLTRAGLRGAPMVLRWLSSFICAPAAEADIRADVDVLVAGLPPFSAAAAWAGRQTG